MSYEGGRISLKSAFALSLTFVALTVGTSNALAAEPSPAAKAVVDYDKAGVKVPKPVRIAYLAECVQNGYCQARLKGIEDAAKKFGFEFKIFDANFNPTEQLKQVQNSVAENFDAFIFAPTAAAPACAMWKQFLVPTGKPVVTVDLPMCADADITKGLAATVTMQRQAYFDAHMENAFSSCSKPCKVAVIGGFIGSDLFNLWEKAAKNAAAKYPNASIVLDQPANFDPRTALRVLQDGLRANPDISVIVSSWDDMSRGAEQAVTSVGKKPGTDVRIYSVGANADGLSRVKEGSFSGTTLLLPYEESYYGAVAAVMAVEGKPLNAYIDEALLPVVTDSIGTIFITKENANKVSPRY
jgi:galactofuranose transport system substrate-binding protein